MEGGGAIEKMIGIMAGAFLSLVFVPPRTIGGFARRTAAAIVFGYMFGGVAEVFLIRWTEMVASEETKIAAYSLTAFLSWTGMGAATKIAKARAAKGELE